MRPKRTNRQGFWQRNKVAYLFLTPWFLGLFVLSLIPMLVSLYLSFTNYNLINEPTWTGFANYAQMFTDDARYMKSLQVTFTYVFLGVPLQLIFALTLALLLNRGVKGLGFFRAIYYVPSLMGGSVAIALLWRQLFGSDGVINDIFGTEGVSWITNPETSLYTLIILMVWQFGSPMVIFLAGLKQIPAELYEAASIDGAGNLGKFFKITLPMLTPIILFNMVMQIISAFQAFTPAYIVGGGKGGVLDSTLFYTLYLYIHAFQQFNMGYASAMAWILLLIVATFTALIFLTSKKWVHYED